ncbi:hypothetical protein LIER_40786 [Lithospermum erythrorhizon]|uniref:BED-type domain-containing protein n=1 Tax=Lithospermum erythrorhizon TaxID=34254 RepID=A0AAV3QZG8_LITER
MDDNSMDEHEPHTDEHVEYNRTPIASPDLDPAPISSPNPVATSNLAPSKVLKMLVKMKKTNRLPRPPSTDEVRVGSEIWDHFTKFETPVRAKCIHCGRDYAADSKLMVLNNGIRFKPFFEDNKFFKRTNPVFK